MKRILVTSYEYPDLDGTACAYAYAEFLQKQGTHAEAGIFGEMHREAFFVFTTFNIPMMKKASALGKMDAFILVDASEPKYELDRLPANKVIEIIDHRKVNEAHLFPNAKVQIEMVGAAATLIAERFFQQNVPISEASAILLHSAIISNTINFQANVTTPRDKKMAAWLQQQRPLPKNYVHDMFAYKSTFTKPLKNVLFDDLAILRLGKTSVSIAQLEIINVKEFVTQHIEELQRLLNEIKREESMDIIFLNCIDIEKGYNLVVATEPNTKKLLASALKLTFKGAIAKSKSIIMRKEIVPKLKETLERP